MTAAVRSRAAYALVGLGLVAWPGSRLDASGFAVESQGARAMGFAGAYIAQASDPSAVYWNPGGVGFLEGSQLYLSGGASSVATEFTGEGGPYPPAGTLEKTDRLFTVLPSLYLTRQLSDRLVLGLGFYAPFDNHSRWRNPDTFTGRYICVDCEVRSWSLHPAIGYRLEDRLAVGFGLDVRFSRFGHKQRLQADPNPFPDPTDVAELTVAGATDTGFGFNVGVLASPSESVSIGLVYRHKVTAEYAGTADFEQIPTGDAAVDEAVRANLPPRQPVTVAHAFPSSFGGGLAVRRGDLTVEGDVVWTFWSSFDTLTLDYPSDGRLETTLLPQRYENVIQGSLGLEYRLADAWAVRGGYAYERSPQPSETLSPFFHDGARHAFGVGGTYRHEKMHLDLFARYLLFQSRATQGESLYGYEGRYDTSAFQLGVALGYRF